MTGASPHAPMQRQASMVDAESLAYLVEDSLRAFDIAGGSETYGDVVSALGTQSELGVESRYAVYLLERNVHSLGYHSLYLERKITVDELSLLHDVHQQALVAVAFCDNGIELLFLFRGAGKRYLTDFFEHL